MNHSLGELADRHLRRISQVDWSDHGVIALHQTDQAVDQIIDVAERPGLAPFAIDSDVLVLQRLNNEVGYDASIVRMHAGTVGIEDATSLMRTPYCRL